MDPASITGLVGTCFSLLAATAKTIKTLHDFKSKYDELDDDVRHLLSRISTIQASVQVLQQWLDTGPATLQLNSQLRTTIEQALDDCVVVVSAIEKHLSRIKYSAGLTPTSGKIKHLWNEDELAKNERGLGYQIQALTLLLQAIQMNSVVEQQRLIAKDDNRKLLRRARDDASSYVDLTDEQLSLFQGTIASNDTNVDAVFDFDDLALDSHAYRAAFRSFLRKERDNSAIELAAPLDPVAETASLVSNSTNQDANRTPTEITTTELPLPDSEAHTTPIDSNTTDITHKIASEALNQSPRLAIYNVTSSNAAFQDILLDFKNIPDWWRAPFGVWKFEIEAAQEINTVGIINSRPNSYVRIKQDYDSHVRGQTKVCKSDRNPQYQEVMYVRCESEVERIYLRVMEERKYGYGHDRCIGSVSVNPAGYILRNPSTGEYLGYNPMSKCEDITKRFVPNGKLLYKVTFLPRLDVLISDRIYSRAADNQSTRRSTTTGLIEVDTKQYHSGLLVFKVDFQFKQYTGRSTFPTLEILAVIDNKPYENFFGYPRSIMQIFASDRDLIIGGFTENIHSSEIELRICRKGKVLAVCPYNSLDLAHRGFSAPTDLRPTVVPAELENIRFKITSAFLPVANPSLGITKGRLRVDVLRAHLYIPESLRFTSSYVSFDLNGKQVFRTQLIRGPNPEWNQHFEVDITALESDVFNVSITGCIPNNFQLELFKEKFSIENLEPQLSTVHVLDMGGREFPSAKLTLALLYSPDLGNLVDV